MAHIKFTLQEIQESKREKMKKREKNEKRKVEEIDILTSILIAMDYFQKSEKYF